MKIETAYDLKQALVKIIEVIDEKNQFFVIVDNEEAHALKQFSAQLSKRREQAVAAIKEHYIELEKTVYPLLDKVKNLRDKLTPFNSNDLSKAIPQVWQLRDLVQLVETMERLSHIPQESWDRLGQLAQIANRTKLDPP